MMPLQELYEELKKHSNFDVGDNTELFLEIVGKILTYKDPSSISVLLDYFDDETDYGFIMQGMIQGIESYPDDVYVKTILHEIKKGIENFPEWFTTIIYGIWNHPNCLKIFKANMNLASKESLLKLFNIMDQESPHHKDLIAELRKELEAK